VEPISFVIALAIVVAVLVAVIVPVVFFFTVIVGSDEND
jgi:hypothetical protein